MASKEREFAYLIHDLSQLLWAIQGRARALASQLATPAADAVALIAADAAAAAAMLADWTGKTASAAAVADPAAVAADAWRQALDQAAARAPLASYRWEGPGKTPAVAVPAATLRRILGNLLANAVEAQPDGGAVVCEASAAGGVLQLTVRDEGPGVPAALSRRLFEPGVSSSTAAGRGLGLAGAREQARNYGGELAYAESPRGGCFVLTLPLAVATRPGLPESLAGTQAVGPVEALAAEVDSALRVLVVDDERPVCEMLHELLLAEGHRPTVVSEADAALAQLAAARYDVVLIDLGLGAGAGSELAAAVRRCDPALAVIMITGWGREHELAACSPACVDLTGVKPVDLPQLRQLLARAAELTAARRGEHQREPR